LPHRECNMKKSIYLIVLIFFFMSQLSRAADNSGCFTCHQYAGQAITAERGKLKILHIDKDRFRKSTHKDLACQDCHKGITTMPPAEKPKIDCNSTCHQGKEEAGKVKKYALNKIHEGQQSVVISLADKSPCRICHDTYPHSRYKMTRAILNKHSHHITCEVCHLEIENPDKILYDWMDAEKVIFKGAPFGVYYDPIEKTLLEAQRTISRIGLYKVEKGGKVPLMKEWNSEIARELKVPEKNWNDDQSIKVINYYHKKIRKMEIKDACQKCHRESGMIVFGTLGYSKKRAQELKDIALEKIVANYEVFHIPQVFMK